MKNEKNEEVKEEKVEEALDKIFEEDYLDVDESNDKNKTNNKYSDDANDFHPLYNFKSFSSDTFSNNLEGKVFNDYYEEPSNDVKTNDNAKTDVVLPSIKTQELTNIPEKKQNKFNFKGTFVSNKKYFIILMIVVLIAVIVLIIKFTTFKPNDIVCTYKVSSDDFEIDEKYVIKDEKNISYVTGTYAYIVKNDAFKSEIDNIKSQKLPVIINSNGVIGFTHNYELGENYIKVYSYYDFSKMDFNYVDKYNVSKKPLSYITINSSTTSASLKKELVKKGYNCVVQREK